MKNFIKIAKDFSENPGLRHCVISDKSGEEFYHKILNELFTMAYKENEILTVDIDNTEGYAPSFLDEAFGNLVFDFTLNTVKKHLKIISTQESSWLDMLENETYKEWEQRRVTEDNPKITSDHKDWNRLINGKLVKKQWL